MFKRINWPSFIPIFLALLALGSLISGFIASGITDIQVYRIVTFITDVIALLASFFIARGISREIYDKLERRRYFKEHPEEDHRNRNS